MKKTAALLAAIILIISTCYGCYRLHSAPNRANLNNENNTDTPDLNMDTFEIPDYIKKSIYTLLLPYEYIHPDEKQETINSAMANLTEKAWRSPTFQYLVRHKYHFSLNYLPVKELNLQKINNNKIKGEFEINLQQGTGLFFRHAYIEFELSRAGDKWVISDFGKLSIKKSDATGLDASMYDMVISLDREGNILPPSDEQELAYYILFKDEVDDYGLGLALNITDILNTGNLDNAEKYISKQALQSRAFQYLYKHRSWWHGPIPVDFGNIKTDMKDNISGTLWINLYGGIQNNGTGSKECQIEFNAQRTNNEWKITDFGRLTILKSTWPQPPPSSDYEVNMKD